MYTRSQAKSQRLNAKELAQRLEYLQLSSLRGDVLWTKDAIEKWRPVKKVIRLVIKRGKVALFRTVLKMKLWNDQVTAFQRCRNRVRVIRLS
jgi:hypothetical protein